MGEAVNKWNLNVVDEIFAPEYIRHNPSALLGHVEREAYKQAFTERCRVFPDARWTLEVVFVRHNSPQVTI